MLGRRGRGDHGEVGGAAVSDKDDDGERLSNS